MGRRRGLHPHFYPVLRAADRMAPGGGWPWQQATTPRQRAPRRDIHARPGDARARRDPRDRLAAQL